MTAMNTPAISGASGDGGVTIHGSKAENAQKPRCEPPERLSLVLPYPPSVNRLYRSVNGRAIKSAEGRAYFARVKDIVWCAVREHPVLPWGLGVRFGLALHPPDYRRRDCSNAIKCLEDAVFAGLGLDDSLVKVLHVEMHLPDRKNPRAEVTLEAA